MNITGIIAEYNPFHNGHLYQLEEARRLTHADYIIIIMNGNFMQRGIPAYWNKYTRAAMALRQGADAVIELPVLYGTASAELFALGGVRLLDQLNVVTHLCFGCETEDMELLLTIADLLYREPEPFRSCLTQNLAEGISFPKARAQAIRNALIDTPLASSYTEHALEELLTKPNTILALEYLKALLQTHSTIQPVPCLRLNADHHQTVLTKEIASATAIRKEYADHGCTSALQNAVPPYVYDRLNTAYQKSSPIEMNCFYPLLQYGLWKPRQPLTDYLDVSEDMANRIQAVFRPEYNFSQLTEAIISKQYTYTRIYRSLLHILLDIRKEELAAQLAGESMHYIRLLGFRRTAAPLLKEIKQKSQLPLITKLADSLRSMREDGDEAGTRLLELDMSCSHLYEQTVVNQYGGQAINEYTAGVIIDDTGYV